MSSYSGCILTLSKNASHQFCSQMSTKSDDYLKSDLHCHFLQFVIFCTGKDVGSETIKTLCMLDSTCYVCLLHLLGCKSLFIFSSYVIAFLYDPS